MSHLPIIDVFLFDTTTLTNPIWTTPSPYGELPSGRFNSATYYDEVTNRLYVHGGDQGNKGIKANHMHAQHIKNTSGQHGIVHCGM